MIGADEFERELGIGVVKLTPVRQAQRPKLNIVPGSFMAICTQFFYRQLRQASCQSGILPAGNTERETVRPGGLQVFGEEANAPGNFFFWID